MKKQLVIIGIIVLLVCVGLSGCMNNPLDIEKNKFIGTWNASDSTGTVTYDFFSDGTVSILIMSGSYEVKDEKLVLTFTGQTTISMVYYYSFSENNTKLSLTSTGTPGQSIVLIKQ